MLGQRVANKSGNQLAEQVRAKGGSGTRNFSPKSETGAAGLFNQGATCYMNSLLQALYHSPEFRAKMYSWRYDPQIHGKRKDLVIPLQLQRLFVRLQLTEKCAVPTKELTDSFGWSEGQSFLQQDVNELRLVLFDALEKTYSETKLATTGDYDPLTDSFVNPYFQGYLERYIRCLECNTSRPQPEPYFDLQVPVKGVGSLEQGLRVFLEPDMLTGDNQYSCGVCDKKTDAAMGMALGKLPYYLTISLRRFDFDYEFFRRIKLNHQVTFPTTLDMAPYVQASASDASASDAPQSLLYELYAVCIHSGGAMGGHYYAFLRDFATGRWLNCNDVHVAAMSEEEVAKGWGADDAVDDKGRKVPGSMANAYMLMYRRVDPAANVDLVPKEEIPPDLLAEVEAENAAFVAEREAFLIKQDTWTFRVLTVPGGPDHLVDVYKKKTLQEATEIVYKALCDAGALDGAKYALDQVRLRDYNTHHNVFGRNFSGQEHEPIMRVKPSLHSFKTIILETREAGAEFPEDVDQILIGAILCDPETPEFRDPVPIFVAGKATVRDLKSAISANPAIPIPVDQLRIMQLLDKITLATREVTANDAALLRDLDIVDGMNVWVERFEDLDSPSLVVERFEEKRSSIDITFNTDITQDVIAADAYQDICFDKRKSLRQLKERFSDILGLPVSKFRLCKSILGKAEYQDQSLSLEDAGLYSGASVWLKEGTPMSSGQYSLRIFLQVPRPSVDATSSDDEPEPEKLPAPAEGPDQSADPQQPPPPPEIAHEEFQFQFIATCDASCKPIEFVETLIPLFAANGVTLTPELVRLRTKTGKTTLGKILLNTKSIRDQIVNLRDSLELVVQPISAPDQFNDETELLLGVRVWLPNRWRLSQKHTEIIVPKDTMVSALQQRLAEQLNIPVAHLELTKLPLRNDPFGIAGSNWQPAPDTILSKSPWYLRTGDHIVVKDARRADRFSLRVDPNQYRDTFETGVQIRFYDASQDVDTPIIPEN